MPNLEQSRQHKDSLPENESAKVPQPFVIRGHHLLNFSDLLYYNRTDLTKSPYTRSFSDATDYVTYAYVKDAWLLDGEYTIDLYFNTPEGLDTYKERMKKVYSTFLQLPDDYPIHIVEEQKDEICKACAIGKHCTEFLKNSTDPKYLNTFLAMAREKNKETDLEVSEEIVTYNNAEASVARRIKTTAGIIREVFRDARIPRVN